MGRQIKAIYKKAESSFNNPEHQKKWQGGIGILVMVVFVLSSVLFNKTVQATIQSAGNYGYYSNGAYGYNATESTADAIPANPTSITCSGSTGGTTATCTVAHSGLTTRGTSAGTLTATVQIYQSDCSTSVTSSTATGTTSMSVAFTGLTAGTTYCAYTHVTDAALNNSASTATTSGVFIAAAGGGTGGGTVTSITTGIVPPPQVVVPLAPSTGLTAQTSAAVTNFRNLILANVLSDQLVSTISPALNVDQVKVTKRLSETEKTITVEILKDLAIKDLGKMKSMLIVTIAALAEKNPQLSTVLGQEGFVRDLTITVGKGVFSDAAKDAKKAEILMDFTVSVALGNAIDRRTFDKDFPLLGGVLKDNEERTIKEGIFQMIFKRLPKTDAEWALIKNISYNARVLGRDPKDEKRALVKVQLSFHIDMKALVKVKTVPGLRKAAKYWTIIQQLGGSGLAF